MKPLRVQGKHLHQVGDGPGAGDPVGAEAVAPAQLPGVGVLPLPGVLVGIAQLGELHHRIGGKIGLQGDERVVVVRPQGENLAHVFRFAVLPPQGGRLLSGDVVDDVGGEPVGALPGGIPADDVGPSRDGLRPDLHRAAVIPHECKVPVNLSRSPHVILSRRRRISFFPDEVTPLYGLRGRLPAEDHLRIVKHRRPGVEKRLIRVGGELLAEHLFPAAAVVGDAPAPPLELCFGEAVELPHGALRRRPLRSGPGLHGVVRVFKPGEEHRLKVVFSGAGRVPAVLEILAAVGGALDDHHGPRQRGHRLEDPREGVRLALRPLGPEGVLRQVDVLQRVAAADAPASGGGAAQPGPEPRTALPPGAGRVFKHQFLGVGGPDHGFYRPGQLLQEQPGHAEQIGGGVLPVGYDQGVHPRPGGAAMEDQGLRQCGKPQLPGFKDDETHAFPRLLLPPGRGVELLLGGVEPEGDHRPALGADLQAAFDIFSGYKWVYFDRSFRRAAIPLDQEPSIAGLDRMQGYSPLSFSCLASQSSKFSVSSPSSSRRLRRCSSSS